MLTDEERLALKHKLETALKNKLTQNGKFPHRAWYPYDNRDGGPSWQHKVWEAMTNKELKEIFVLAANSVGKSAFVAMTIVYILNNDHAFCRMFNEPIHVHVISKSWSTQKLTIQGYLEKMTDNGISGISGMEDKQRYHIRRDGDIIKTITCRQGGNKVTFASAEEGASGNVGVRPHLLISDEPVSEALYKELAMRTTTENSKFMMLATVAEAEHAWVCVRALEHIAEPKPSIMIITAGMIDNPFVPLDVIEHRKISLGEDSADYRVRVLGQIESITGIVYKGIEKCLVDNEYIPEEYRAMPVYQQAQHFAWAESYDFGVGAKDPFIGCFFKLWSNGEIVQEDEIILFDESPEAWANAIHKKRKELDLPFKMDGQMLPNGRVSPHHVFDKNEPVRKPKYCYGDKQYLGRRVQSTNALSVVFARRKIYIEPSKGDPVNMTLPICQDLVFKQVFKIKERCKFSYKYARSYQTKFTESTGKVSYDSPYDHWSDCFRYLVERIAKLNRYVQDYKEHMEFLKATNMRQNVLNSVNQYRAI